MSKLVKYSSTETIPLSSELSITSFTISVNCFSDFLAAYEVSITA